MANLDAYKELFIKTAQEHLNTMNLSLKRLHRNPKDQIAIADLHRTVHGLKSSSILMGHPHLSTLAQTIEKLFLAVINKKLVLNKTILATLDFAHEEMQCAIDGIAKGKPGGDFVILLQTLINYLPTT